MKSISRDHRIYVLHPRISRPSSSTPAMTSWWKPGTPLKAPASPVPCRKSPSRTLPTGPIYVNGTEPGDAQRIEFVSIKPKETPPT